MRNVMVNIYNQISGSHSYRTFQGRAPQSSTFPHVVYKLMPIDNTEKNRDDYSLEVSCWDKSEGTSHMRVVELAEKVRDALLDYRDLDDYNLLIVSRPSMGYIPDPDEQIKRYDVTATLMTYRR